MDTNSTNQPKRVLVLFDVLNWTWHRRALDLHRFAGSKYDVQILSGGEVSHQIKRDRGRLARYDGVFFMDLFGHYPGHVGLAKRAVVLVTSSGVLHAEHREDDWDSRIVTHSRNARNAALRLPKFSAAIAVNQEIAEATRQWCKDVRLIPSGVNDHHYVLGPIRTDQQKPLVVGWCANPSGRSVKGHDEVLVPLMARLSGDERFEWRVLTNNYQSPGVLNRQNMVEWYHGIDVLLCTSINDGTPSPIFEASCTGRTILSTDVGCVRDWPEVHELGLVAPRYRNAEQCASAIDWFQAKLLHLVENRDELASAGLTARESCVQRFSWTILAPEYLRVITGESNEPCTSC